MTIHQPNLTGDGDDAFRASVVGGSEVSALFGANPWLTEFELWHRKNGTVATPDFAHNERTKWGLRLEPIIIQAACEEYGYTVAETPVRLDNGKGLGGHPDQVVMCPRRGRGILEVKTADWLVAKGWGDEPPLNYLLQIQTYMGLAGVDWGDVIVLVGGNELRRFEYEFRPVIFADIEARVERFWQSVRDGEVPPANPERDCATLIDAIGAPNDGLADLRGDIHAADLAQDYLDAKAAAKAAELRAEVAKCELMLKIGANGAALLDGFKISANQTKGSSGTLVTQEMVGTYIGARKGWRRFDVKEKN
ncbi:endonuclease [Sphingobium jiangsuense]|uniref:Putative phage-type endonuclease n=1 Tax=Sphingobium jiangsuense TaxID=870476 RepID=A0A7W6FS57_9SPHN|nr:YqaJ viral recombinase family protein [Sphingobium jiangsuense]MBB3928886.1 putative phage-type endonuclease [Sphingobium jiangsuense]GLT02931.1 endonuclease [Sphingobium jiangsuense]